MENKIKITATEKEKYMLQEHGFHPRFLARLGLQPRGKTGKIKNSIKIYIPMQDLELIQLLAIYYKLNQTSISLYTRHLLKELGKKLLEEKDPVFLQAKIILKELKEHKLREFISPGDNEDLNL